MKTTRNVTVETEITPTPKNKGLMMTITVKAYDTGMIEVDGRPINDVEGGYDQGIGWLGAAETVLLKLGELRKQAAKR
jgi:xanthine dehydrogenase molybdopterin-binding subunit B